jgi:hypothetical protein
VDLILFEKFLSLGESKGIVPVRDARSRGRSLGRGSQQVSARNRASGGWAVRGDGMHLFQSPPRLFEDAGGGKPGRRGSDQPIRSAPVQRASGMQAYLGNGAPVAAASARATASKRCFMKIVCDSRERLFLPHPNRSRKIPPGARPPRQSLRSLPEEGSPCLAALACGDSPHREHPWPCWPR